MFTFLLVPVVAAQIVMGPCPGLTPANSCYMPPTNTIYMAAQDQGKRGPLAHELGHAYDYKVLHGQRPFGLEEEPFADLYAACAADLPWRYEPLCGWLWQRAPYRLLIAATRPALRSTTGRARR
jgi:predicted component of type VI protein secretion system